LDPLFSLRPNITADIIISLQESIGGKWKIDTPPETYNTYGTIQRSKKAPNYTPTSARKERLHRRITNTEDTSEEEIVVEKKKKKNSKNSKKLFKSSKKEKLSTVKHINAMFN